MVEPSGIEFVPASQTDARMLATLRVEAMRESLEAVGRFDPERARNRFLNSFDPLSTTKILRTDELVGFFAVKARPDHILLDHLYIVGNMQGSGLGSKVMNLIKAQAMDASLPIQLCALKGSPANAFYRHHGFELQSFDELDNYYRFCG